MNDVPVAFAPAEEEVAKKIRKPRKLHPKYQMTEKKLVYENKTGTLLFVRFPFDEKASELTEDLKARVPGVSLKGYDYVDGIQCLCYYIPYSMDALTAIHKFGRSHRFVFDADIAARAQAATEDGRELFRMSDAKSNSTIEIPKLGGTLKPYQRAGVAYLLRAKKSFLADEMGIGKTITSLAAIHTAKAYPALIVVPASIKINWQREARKWLPRTRKIVTINKNSLLSYDVDRTVRKERKAELDRIAAADVVIINYDKLHRWLDWLIQVPFKCIVSDEAHFLRHQAALRTRTFRALVKSIDPEYVFMLTGTPALNRPRELMGQLASIGRLDDFGGRGYFLKHYCLINRLNTLEMESAGNDNATKNKMIAKAHENLIKLNEQLRALCYVRRTKQDVLHDLPQKQRTSVFMDIDNRKEYQRAEDDVIAWLGDLAEKDEKFLASIKKLDKETKKQLIKEYRSSVEMKSARAQALVRISQCKQLAALGKLERSLEWIHDALEDGGKMVVFAVHKAVVDRVMEEFPDALHILSNDSDERRQEAVDEFKNNPEKKLIVISLKIGGVGIDGLQGACSRGVFLELGWNPGTHDQAEDRLHRIGQEESVNWYYHLAHKTIEERIAALIEKKRVAVNALSDGDPMKDVDQGSILGELIYDLIGKEVKL